MNPLLEIDDDDDAREQQRERRLRTLGTRCPRCSVPGCGEDDPFALTGVAPAIVCREHSIQATGSGDGLEHHHVAGRQNAPDAVVLPANDHGALSADQQLWPKETLRNPRQSPLRGAAAWLRGWLGVLRVIIDRGVGRIPAALERLDEILSDYFGPGWWDTLGWDW